MTAGLAFFLRHMGESYNFQAILFFVPPVLYQVDFAERSFANNAAELVLGQRHYVCGRGGGEVGPDQMGTKNKNFEDKISNVQGQQAPTTIGLFSKLSRWGVYCPTTFFLKFA